MKKRKILHRLLVFVLTIAMLAGICPQGIHIADVPLTLPEVKAADTIGNPKIEEDTTMTAGQKVTWDCIYFGSYPQSEITSKDGSVYNKLKNATSWDNNDTTIDGVKYRRLKGEDATQHAYSGGSEQYYDWNDDYTTYHYFKYEPIKWRVLNKDNNDVFLLSDIALDDQRYNEKWATITWEKSSMRSWINGYKASENQPEIDYSNKNFIDTAFSTAQKNAIKTTKAPSIKPFKATGKPKQIAAGKKVNLKAEIGLPDSITKQLTWKSSNTKVATVNADGVVTVKKKTGGKKVTITASNDKIKVSASWKVTSMKGIVKKVKITGTKTVKAGKSLKLKANVTATKKANKKLQWTSSNAKYATVNAEGVVKTKKVAKGKTIKITAMATDGSNKKATFKVKVK